jgi:hypothetical protein
MSMSLPPLADLQIAATLLGDGAPAANPDVLRRLKADVEVQLNALRNAAYAGGFAAARGAVADRLGGLYA